jgi:histidyl-tRNA synthetase
LEKLNIPKHANQKVLRALDKLGKIGREDVIQEMTSGLIAATPEQANDILKLSELTGDNDEILRQVEALVAGNATGQAGVGKLKEVLDGAAAAGVPIERVRLDLSIARGLDYYTGTIFETFLTALPGIGSVCSGGRYDNLAKLFTSQELPGIGASLGLDRLLAAMEELGMIEKISTPAPVFIPYFDKDRLHDYLRLAAALRAAGVGVEVFPEPKKLGQQLKYADRRGFHIALIAGGDEFSAGVVQVKNLQTGEKQDAPLADNASAVVAAVRKILEPAV